MKKPIESKAWIYPIQENAHDESYFYSKEVGWNHGGVGKGIITEWVFFLPKNVLYIRVDCDLLLCLVMLNK